MSCQFCNEDEELSKAKEDARKYTKETGKATVIYLEGTSFKFMEAAAFFEKPEGRPIDCISSV